MKFKLHFILLLFYSQNSHCYSRIDIYQHIIRYIKKIHTSSYIKQSKNKFDSVFYENHDILKKDELKNKRIIVKLYYYGYIRYSHFYKVDNYNDYLNLIRDKIFSLPLVNITIFHQLNYGGLLVDTSRTKRRRSLNF